MGTIKSGDSYIKDFSEERYHLRKSRNSILYTKIKSATYIGQFL